MQHTTKQVIDGFPGLKDMPVLGALFRSRDFQNDETELVVLVSAYLVNPTAEARFGDADRRLSCTPTDPETLLLGRLNAVYKKNDKPLTPAGRRRRSALSCDRRTMMRQHQESVLRGFRLAAVLLAGSCAAPDQRRRQTDRRIGAVNHPITVEPSYQSLKLSYSPADAGLTPADAAAASTPSSPTISAHGNGSIAISAPAGARLARRRSPISPTASTTWACRRDHILVATHDAAAGDMQVEINYVAYQAHTDACGDWSEDLAYHRWTTARRRISAAPCSRISPPWSPIRAI